MFHELYIAHIFTRLLMSKNLISEQGYSFFLIIFWYDFSSLCHLSAYQTYSTVPNGNLQSCCFSFLWVKICAENKAFCIVLTELIEFFCSISPMYISELYSVRKLEITKGTKKKKSRQSFCHSQVIKSLGHLCKFLLADQQMLLILLLQNLHSDLR